jgi:hypothetical protein
MACRWHRFFAVIELCLNCRIELNLSAHGDLEASINGAFLPALAEAVNIHE